MFHSFHKLKHLGILPGLLLALSPCIPQANLSNASHLVQIQICTTPGQVKYLVLNLDTGEMFEQTVTQQGAGTTHQKCGHSMCQDTEAVAKVTAQQAFFIRQRRTLPIVFSANIEATFKAANARGPPVIT